MAELVDAQDLKSCWDNISVPVRFRLRAQKTVQCSATAELRALASKFFTTTMIWNAENIITLSFAILALGSAIMMITRRSPITSALYLIVNFFAISGVYLMLRSQFVAIIQILVYAGAIMVLFLFVIMLLNLSGEKKLLETFSYKKISAIILGLMLFASLGITAFFAFFGKYKTMNPNAEIMGTIQSVGKELYTTYSFPFELVSFILLAAIVGAIVLAQKKFE